VSKSPRTAADLLAEARETTAGWADDAINAEAIRTALHCSAANSRVLRDALLTERAELAERAESPRPYAVPVPAQEEEGEAA
jgi:hypothetical protein